MSVRVQSCGTWAWCALVGKRQVQAEEDTHQNPRTQTHARMGISEQFRELFPTNGTFAIFITYMGLFISMGEWE